MRVELFLAKEDFTWTTEVVEVPDAVGLREPRGSPDWDYVVTAWAHGECKKRGRVFPLIAIWNAYPEDEPEVELNEDEEEEIANIPQDID